MNNKEYNEMIKLYLRLKYLIEKYDDYMDCEKPQEKSPIIIPEDIYDDICDVLGRNEIGLMGIS